MRDYREMNYWLGSTDYTPNPALSDEIEADVVIASGGFRGLAVEPQAKVDWLHGS